MLLSLRIENFAIIESTLIDFSKGFTVLTGETGAGKSILMDALGLILGDRVQKDMIRQGQTGAEIEAVFASSNPRVARILEENGIEVDEVLTIRKNIYLDRPTISRINGRSVANTVLSKLTGYLADSTHQQQNQTLLQSATQLHLLDRLAGDDQKERLGELSTCFDRYRQVRNFLSSQEMDEQSRLRELDIIAFQIEELEELDLKEDEDLVLESEYKKITSSAKIKETFARLDALSEGEQEVGLRNLLDRYSQELGRIEGLDESYSKLYKRVEGIRYEWLDIFSEARSLYEALDMDEEKLFALQTRLDQINRMKRKYGNTYAEIEDNYKRLKKRLEFLNLYEEEMQAHKQELDNLRARAENLSEEIGKRRRKVATSLEEKMEGEMRELNIPEGKFSVKFEKSELSNLGMDKITYMISTNPGEELKPLSTVASGGEMSRILLAFKTIMAWIDETETLIFDEIDAGMSGRTAKIVAEKMKKLSLSFQLIVISHLPQVVAVADDQYQIIKEVERDRTISKVKKLNFEERVESLATMISGEDEAIAKKAAKSMLKMNL